MTATAESVKTAAAARTPPDNTDSNALDQLTALAADDLTAVNETIVRRMDSPVELIPQLAGYIVASGGKRLRPLLTLACARLCGHTGHRHIGLAAAVEFIHTATLLHDDVVDESDLRRGQASANELFGNKPSVLVGDFLFARAFELMVEDGSIEVLRTLSRASAVIAEGEVLQLAAANDIATDRSTYIEVIRAKTAELFAAACRVGAMVGVDDTAVIDALYAYGLNLGLAFQIIDDVLDYSAEQARLGKTVGDDFREGKMTLPVILAIAAGSAEDRAFWARAIEERDQRDGDLDAATARLHATGALAASAAEARQFADAARQAVRGVADGPLFRALDALPAFVVDRDF